MDNQDQKLNNFLSRDVLEFSLHVFNFVEFAFNSRGGNMSDFGAKIVARYSFVSFVSV